MKKRILSMALVLCMAIALLPTGVLAGESPIFSGGDGTQTAPYEISTAQQLVDLAAYVNAGNPMANTYFKQTATIDMTGIEWEPIGYTDTDYYFSGNYDGNGYSISNLTCAGKVDGAGQATAGLFGCVRDGTISNVTIESANISVATGTAYSHAGALLAIAYPATVSNCSVENSTVSASRAPAQAVAAGGLVGYVSFGSSFASCRSLNNTVSSICFSGGFAGNCDNSGNGNSFTDCVVENCAVKAGNTDAGLGAHAGGFSGTVESGESTLLRCKVLNCTLGKTAEDTYNPVCGIFWAGTFGGSFSMTNCGYYTTEETPAYFGTATKLVKIGDDYVAVADVNTAAGLDAALADNQVGYINVTGSFSYDGAISKAVAINVKSGNTLTLNYSTNATTKVSTVCNANITVENGGTVCFKSTASASSKDYFVMNGAFTLNEGAFATTATSGFNNSILFQGAFTNNGSFDVAKGKAFLKYGTTPGTFTGTPCWNLHIAEATKTSAIDPKLYITGVAGTVAVGEKLHPVLDGFGEITEAIPGLGISWGDSSNGGITYEYTVPASKAGSAITVRVNGSPSNSSYAYFIVSGTTVTKVTTPDSAGFKTAKVAQLDTVYVGGASKSDSNTGASADKALATFATAYNLVADGGMIVVCGATTGGSSSSWVRADKSITISNTDGTATYADAQLDWPCIMFSKTVTVKNVKLINSNSQSKQFNLYPLAASAVVNLENISSEGAVLVYNQAGTSTLNNSTFNIKNTSNLVLVTEGYANASYPTINLDHSTVISNNSTAVLGDVSLKNGSTLLATQTINNLTADNSDNSLSLLSDKEGTPMPITVNGTVTISEGKPIKLLKYTGSAYEAFAAGNLTLLTSSAENTSLTADKFVTMDTVKYGLKKDGNSIVTQKKIIVTFDANGGTCGTTAMAVDANGKLASLPTPVKSGSYTFDGWYTSETGGTKITTGNVYTDSTTVYAHWTYTGGSSGGDFTPPSVTVPVSGDEGTVSVSASVSDSTATITVTDQQLAEIAGNAAGTGAVTVDLSGIKNVDSAKIPAKMVAAANAATGAGGLEIILPTGTVKLDEKALASVASSNTEITFSVEEVKTSGLTAAQKEALGDKLDSAVVVDVNVLVNGTKTSDFGGGTITVSFPYTPKAGEDPSKLTIWFIKDDGTIEKMGGHYDAKNKCFVFETTHLSRYALVSDTRVNPFTDVTDTDYYYDAVLWAVDKGVTSGISATSFAPNATCTRAQAVTFLWRAMGSPEPSSAVNPFADVKSDAYYYKAVLWAMEKGITSGTSAKSFSPETICSRSQAVTFLWSAAGSPVVNYAMSFTDVPADSYFTEAVRWAVSEGITSGTGATTFSPAADCTRAQTVSFLWRYRSK